MPRVDPFTNFRFLVQIDGIVQAGFSECSGLGSRIQVIEYREGNEPATTRKIPGLVKFSNIVLKRGLTTSRELFDWHMSAVQGRVERRNGSIIVLDDDRTEKLRWNFRNAWPSKWEGPTLVGKGKDVAIETLELTHEGLDLAS